MYILLTIWEKFHRLGCIHEDICRAPADSPSLKEVIKKDNPGLVRALAEQVEVLVRAEESEEYIQAFITGFYSCYFLIKEAMTDEGLN